MYFPQNIIRWIMLSCATVLLLPSCAVKELTKNSPTVEKQSKDLSRYAGHTIRVYRHPQPLYGGAYSECLLEQLFPKTYLESYYDLQKQIDEDPFGDLDTYADLNSKLEKLKAQHQTEGYNVLKSYYYSTESGKSWTKKLQYVPTKKSFGLADTECIATNKEFIYVLATEEKHKAIYDVLKPNIIELIHEFDRVRTYELSIRVGSGTDKEKELARIYTPLSFGHASIGKSENIPLPKSGFHKVIASNSDKQKPAVEFTYSHNGKIYTKSFTDIPDSSTQETVLEKSTPETTLTAHLQATPRTTQLHKINCPYPEAIPLPNECLKNPSIDPDSANHTRSIHMPVSFIVRLDPSDYSLDGGDPFADENEPKKPYVQLSKELISLNEEVANTLKLKKGTVALDKLLMLESFGVEGLVYAYFIPATSQLVIHGSVKSIDQVYTLTRSLYSDPPLVSMNISLLHYPIPTFGSWINEEDLKRASLVDRVTLPHLPGDVKLHKASNIQSVETASLLASGVNFTILHSALEFKLSNSPLTRNIEILRLADKPLYIPLEIDTETQTLSVLKISTSKHTAK